MSSSSQSLVDLCSARVGTTLKGKWRLDRVIGIGGMAAVYEATHKIGRKEAIKMLHPEIARSPDLCARFEQEARATNKLSHPGAVEIRDIDVADDGCPFLVMELLEGENLGDRATRLGGIDEADMLRYVDALLDVLAAAHAASIVHRDIKLENLFVTTAGELKVLDFGIARMRSGPALTRTGMRLGTTSYMSPEQVRGKDVDGRADVFAVGATMFRLIARRRIHEAETDAELVAKMAAEPAPPLASVAKVSRELAMVVDRALTFEVNDRYPSATAMQSDIAALRRGEPPEFALARAASRSPEAPPAAAPPSMSFAITTERTTMEGATQRAGALAAPTRIEASPATTPYPQPPPQQPPPQQQQQQPPQQPPSQQQPPPQQAPSSHALPHLQVTSPAQPLAFGQGPASWSPASTFASTAPQSMGHVQAVALASTPPRAAHKRGAGIAVVIAIAGIALLGLAGVAFFAYAPEKEETSAASERDDDAPKSKRKKVADDEDEDASKPVEEAATKKEAPSANDGSAPGAAPTHATAPATATAPAKPQVPANRGPTTSLPDLGVAFPPPASSAKASAAPKDKDKGKGRPDIFVTPR